MREGFRRAEYLGDGRYAVIFEGTRTKEEPLFFLSREMPVFSITPKPDGTIEIGAFHSDAIAQRKFTESGARINGTLNVTVERGVKVLKHNAQTIAPAPGHCGVYNGWIKSPDADPFIIVQPVQ